MTSLVPPDGFDHVQLMVTAETLADIRLAVAEGRLRPYLIETSGPDGTHPPTLHEILSGDGKALEELLTVHQAIQLTCWHRRVQGLPPRSRRFPTDV
jgi:hypothetical protein